MSGLLVVCSAVARAQTEAEPLRWERDTPCSAPHDVSERLRELLPNDIVPSDGDYVATVTESHAGYRLQLRDDDQTLLRDVELTSCDEARETALLMVAMALQPALTPTEEPTETAVKTAPAAWRMGLAAGALIDFVTLPAPAPGAMLSAQLQRGLVRVSLAARYAAREQTDDLPQGVRAKLDLLGFAPTGCAQWSSARLSLAACAQVELGRVQGRALGAEQPRTQRALWLSVGGAGLAEYTLTQQFALQLTIHAGAALRRARFALENSAPFHELPRASVYSALQLVFWWSPKDSAGPGQSR